MSVLVAENGVVLKSHFVRRKDGVIFSYPHPAAESKKRAHEFELRLTEDERVKRLNDKNATSATFELDQAQREHNQKMADQIKVMQENNQKLAESQKEITDELALAKKHGATNVDRQKIIDCPTYATGLTKTSIKTMTLEEIIYAAYHKFGAELNPYAPYSQLKKDFSNLVVAEREREAKVPKVEEEVEEPYERQASATGERMLSEYPMGEIIENMDIDDLKIFCKEAFNVILGEELSHEGCFAQALELKNKFYPDKL